MKKHYLYSLVLLLTSLLFMRCEDKVKVKLDDGGPQFTIDAAITGKLSLLANQSIPRYRKNPFLWFYQQMDFRNY